MILCTIYIFLLTYLRQDEHHISILESCEGVKVMCVCVKRKWF